MQSFHPLVARSDHCTGMWAYKYRERDPGVGVVNVFYALISPTPQYLQNQSKQSLKEFMFIHGSTSCYMPLCNGPI